MVHFIFIFGAGLILSLRLTILLLGIKGHGCHSVSLPSFTCLSLRPKTSRIHRFQIHYPFHILNRFTHDEPRRSPTYPPNQLIHLHAPIKPPHLSLKREDEKSNPNPPHPRFRSHILLPPNPQTPMDDLPPRVVRHHLRRPILLQPTVSPSSLIPNLRTFSICNTSNSHQPLHTSRPYFPPLLFLELVLHLPLTLWMIPALLRADPLTPLALLIFGIETSVTTLVCLAEMRSWEELSKEQRGWEGLGGMYGGYLAVGEWF